MAKKGGKEIHDSYTHNKRTDRQTDKARAEGNCKINEFPINIFEYPSVSLNVYSDIYQGFISYALFSFDSHR